MKVSSLVSQYIPAIKTLSTKLLWHVSEKDVFIRQNHSAFKVLNYERSLNLEEAALFAEKNFGVKNFNINDLSSAKLLNQIFTKIHNVTRGKASFPPVVSIINKKTSRFSGECGNQYIEVIKTPYISNDIIHEIGHYNHQKCCSNFYKMGKLQELINDGIKDFTIYEQFKNDKESLKLIKKYISPYATSSAAEFVACTFNAIINGKKLPTEIYNLYKKYEGPFTDVFIYDAKVKKHPKIIFNREI